MIERLNLRIIVIFLLICFNVLGIKPNAFADSRQRWENFRGEIGLLKSQGKLDAVLKSYEKKLTEAKNKKNIIGQIIFSNYIMRFYLLELKDYAKTVEYAKQMFELIAEAEKQGNPSTEPDESFYPWSLEQGRSWLKVDWYNIMKRDADTLLQSELLSAKRYSEIIELASWEMPKVSQKGERVRQIELACRMAKIYLDEFKSYSQSIEYADKALRLLDEGIKLGPENEPDDWFYVYEDTIRYGNIPLEELKRKIKVDWFKSQKSYVLNILYQSYDFLGEDKKAEFYSKESSIMQPSEQEIFENLKQTYQRLIEKYKKDIEWYEQMKVDYIAKYGQQGYDYVIKDWEEAQDSLRRQIKECEEDIKEAEENIEKVKVGETVFQVNNVYQRISEQAARGDFAGLRASLKEYEAELYNTSFSYRNQPEEKEAYGNEDIYVSVYQSLADTTFSYGLYNEAYDYVLKAEEALNRFLKKYEEWLVKKGKRESEKRIAELKEEKEKMVASYGQYGQPIADAYDENIANAQFKGLTEWNIKDLEEKQHDWRYQELWLIAGKALRKLSRFQEAIEFLKKAYCFKLAPGSYQSESLNQQGIPLRIVAIQELSYVFEEAKMQEKCIEVLKEVIDYFEGIRAKLTLSGQKISYLSQYNENYVRLISLLAFLNRTEEALSYTEKARGRAFVDLLGEKVFKPKNQEIESLVEKKKAIEFQYAELLKQDSGIIADSRERSIKVIQKQMDEVLEELAKKDAEFSSTINVPTLNTDEIKAILDDESILVDYYLTPDAIFIWVITNKSVVFKKVEIPRWVLAKKIAEFRQRILDPQHQPLSEILSEVRLETTPQKFKNGSEHRWRVYVKNNSSLFLSIDALILKSGKQSYPLPVLEKEILPQQEKVIYEYAGKWKESQSIIQVVVETDQGKLVSNLEECKVDAEDMVTIEDKGFSRDNQHSLEEIKKYAAVSLYDILIKHIQPYLTKKRIYLVPHGLLHYLPFAAIEYNGRYLIEDYALSYLPSATVYKFCKDKAKKQGERILALGNPDLKDPRLDIPFALKEVEAISNLYPSSRVLVKALATRAAFKSLSSNYDILHLACHGIFDAENPLNSCLLLAATEKEDGRLTMSEIFDLKFNVGLVTLSACESGMSRIKAGDETMGLPRAFIYAGSPAVVASLWNVNDESTSILMEKFYFHLKTCNKAQALQLAQLDLFKDKRYRNPYYWAAFYLVGEQK